MMYMDTYDQVIQLPISRVMQPVQLPQNLILRIILYLIPSQALQWIRHDFHHNRYVRAPMLHEVFGAGCLPTYIDMSRYGGTTYTLLLYNSRIARSRNYLHDTVSQIHIALLNIVYWIPMSSLSRGNVIRTIGICREHEEHWSYIRPHYPLRTYSFTSRFIISDNLCDRVLVSIEWNWHISDVIFWFAGNTRNMVSESNMRGQLDPERFMATRHIEHLDPAGNPWHPGYRLNGTPSRRPTTHNLPACAFSIPMSTQHTQQLIQGLQQCRHANHKIHFDILNNDYCLTSHLIAGAAMTIPINDTQQIAPQQQQQQQQHNLTNIMHTRHARRGYTITDTASNMHATDVFFSFRTHGDRRLQRTLMRHLAQIPYDDDGMNGFDLMLQQRPPAIIHGAHDQSVQPNLTSHDT